MTIRSYLLLAAVGLCLGTGRLSAQQGIDMEHNAPRDGDRMEKRQTRFQDPGGTGTGQFWDFSQAESEKTCEVEYIRHDGGDSLLAIENRTLHYCFLSGDSLLLPGYENPVTLVDYRRPELLMAYPLTYGESLVSYPEGRGVFGNCLFAYLRGRSRVCADAQGDLVLPGGDTLRNVLRVHTHKAYVLRPLRGVQDTLPPLAPVEEVERLLSADTSRVESDVWQWYAEGVRYPVFESVCNRRVGRGGPADASLVSYYYPPADQYYDLPADPQNQLREAVEADARQAPDRMAARHGEDGLRYECRVDDDNVLRVSFSLPDAAQVRMTLYDMQGRFVASLYDGPAGGEGWHSAECALSRLSGSDYLLHVVCGGESRVEKILKRK